MAEITAALVKELREKTGAGMMDCKKALTETGGNLDEAVDWLRKKGLSTAAKKAGRAATEGLVGVAVSDDAKAAALVEVNAETDFVAKNDMFKDFVSRVAALALANNGDLEAVRSADYGQEGRSVEDQLTHLIATIGENMSLRRVASLSVDNGVISSYIHNDVAPGLGKIGVLVALKSDAPADKLDALGKQIAMHIAAMSPQSLDVDSLDPEAIERERNVLSEQARASGKPEEIIEKMVEGRLRKFYEEVVLLQQTFVVDGETRIAKLLEVKGKEFGSPVEITGFVRFGLGEGLEKKQEDFAAEVAAVAGS
ncbi:MAG: elongation factor Ts [Alphaproteobacteria bacterium]|nr:MAG: elongation factor Ts [Alphaproteobacteria bacterium]